MLDEIPILNEDSIQSLASAKVFARGRELLDEGVLEALTRQGEKISALCQGSDEEPYALSAQVSAQNVLEAHCSCPYEHGGFCKHLVALLLAWAHAPESFQQASTSVANMESELADHLRSRERDELAELVEQLVEVEPKLRAVVWRLLQPQLSEEAVVKTRRSVESLLRKVVHMGMGYETHYSLIKGDLQFYLRSAAVLESSRPEDAGNLYVAVLKGMMAFGSNPFNSEEDQTLADAGQQCIEVLTRLLPHASSPLRAQWLEVICQVYLLDFQIGGSGFSTGAESALEMANAEEWPRLEALLNAFLHPGPKPLGPKRKFSTDKWLAEARSGISKWERDKVVALKARCKQKFDGK